MRQGKLVPDLSIEHCVAGTVVYPPGGTYGPRLYRDDVQLLLLDSGSMEIAVDDAEYRVLPGQIMLLLPDQTVSIAFDAKEPSRHRWITASLAEFGPEAKDSLRRLPRMLPISEQMNRLVDLSVRQMRPDTPEHRDVLHTFALAAIRLYGAECLSSDEHSAHPIVGQAKAIIHEKYAEPLAMRDIAECANVSASHLARVFRKHEQMTPLQYLWRYRVETSLVLLRTTGLSIGEIAERCGFKSRYHYSRLVKTITCQSPGKIRALHWKR